MGGCSLSQEETGLAGAYLSFSADVRCVPPKVVGFADFLTSDFRHLD